MAGVHGGQHVERLGAAALPDDDAVGPHPQRVAHQVADRDVTDALGVRRSRFEAHDVILVQPQFGGVFNRHDAAVAFDDAGECVEQRGLARAGAAAHDHVAALSDNGAEQRDDLGRREFVEADGASAEPSDGEVRTVDGQRRHDGVHARSVGETGVDCR